MAIEIVDFPLNSMVIFHSYVTVYHKVSMVKQAPGSSWVLKPCQPFGFPADLPSKSIQSFSLRSIWGKTPQGFYRCSRKNSTRCEHLEVS